MTRRPWPSETGSGTIWVLVLCVLLWFVAAVVVIVASLRVDRQRAITAADLAALAAAREAVFGASRACERAAETAASNAAELRGCDLTGYEVTVEVAVPVRLWPEASVTAEARAGPVTGAGLEPPEARPHSTGPDPGPSRQPTAVPTPAPGRHPTTAPGHGPGPLRTA